MALLSESKRAKVWREIMSQNRFPSDILKADLRAAVDAADVWLDANWLASTGVSFNASLPQPYRGAATRKQKAYIIAKLADARAGEEV